jgi:hypothetical protein
MTTVLYWVGVMLLSMLTVTAIAVWAWLVYQLFPEHKKSVAPAGPVPEYKLSATFKLRSPKR